MCSCNGHIHTFVCYLANIAKEVNRIAGCHHNTLNVSK